MQLYQGRYFIKGDYHTHTYASDGKQNVSDIVTAAKEKGYQEVAISDHGPFAAGIGIKDASVYLQMKQEIDSINSLDENFTALLAAEANVRGLEGTLDIDADIIAELDILIAGIHPYTLPCNLQDAYDLFLQNTLRHLSNKQRSKAIENNTIAIINCLKNNPEVDILSHPGLFFAVDYEEVALACKKCSVFFEINCGHEHPLESDIIKVAKSGVNFIINSDAHFTKTVGELQYGLDLLDSLKISSERIYNIGGYKQWGRKKETSTYS